MSHLFILVDCPVSYAHITEMKWLTNGHHVDFKLQWLAASNPLPS